MISEVRQIIFIPVNMYKELDSIAEDRETPITQIMLEAFRDYIEREQAFKFICSPDFCEIAERIFSGKDE